jgi:regulatory protein
LVHGGLCCLLPVIRLHGIVSIQQHCAGTRDFSYGQGACYADFLHCTADPTGRVALPQRYHCNIPAKDVIPVFTFVPMNTVAMEKLRRYCAYQERCHEEVRTKLLELKVYGEELEEIIAQLVAENFLNEERFACAYARGKFRMRQWGRVRIRKELQFRKISDYCIRKAMEEIEEEEYLQTIDTLIARQRKKQPQGTPAQRYYRTMQYMLRKGYEADLVRERLS